LRNLPWDEEEASKKFIFFNGRPRIVSTSGFRELAYGLVASSWSCKSNSKGVAMGRLL
jgi:hypothetical protein